MFLHAHAMLLPPSSISQDSIHSQTETISEADKITLFMHFFFYAFCTETCY